MLSLLTVLALQQLGPVLPVGAAPHLTELNLNIQRNLESGDFAGAQRLLARWPNGRLSFQATEIPAEFRDGLSSASALVKEATGDRIEFGPGNDPRVVFTFAELPPEGPKEPVWREDRVHLEVPITDRDGQPANPRSVVASLAKGMAFAAGLDVTTKRRSLTGAVIYTKTVADPTYSPREQLLFTQIDLVRQEIERAVQGKTRLTPAIPNISATPDVVDFGTVTQGDREEFIITIKNSGNAPAVVEIETTCACIVAQPSFILGPGETVTQKPRFDSTDYQGELDKHLYVLSNSPSNPRLTISMKGMIVPEVRFIQPKGARSVHSVGGDGFYEVEVPDSGPASLELLFYGTSTPVELIDVQLGNRSVSAQFLPFSGTVDDPLIGSAVRSGSKVTLNLPSTWPYGVNWLRVVGVTNSRRRPSVEMTLQVRKGIAASPQSMYFGDAKVGQESERSVMVEHGSKAFTITKIDAPEGVTARFEKGDESGRRYKISARIKPTSAGQVSGIITLTTDSPFQPTITVPIGGQAG